MSTTSEISISSVGERRLYSKIFWRIIPLLMICLLFSWFDRINVGFAKYDMQHSFPLSNTAYGLGASLFVVGYILFEVPSNLLLSRVGARRHFARILIVWGLASAAMMFVHSTTEFYALRFIIGGAEAGFTPGIFLYLSTWFPEQRRGRVYGVLYQAVAFSGILGAPLSGLILTRFAGTRRVARLELGLSARRHSLCPTRFCCPVLSRRPFREREVVVHRRKRSAT